MLSSTHGDNTIVDFRFGWDFIVNVLFYHYKKHTQQRDRTVSKQRDTTYFLFIYLANVVHTCLGICIKFDVKDVNSLPQGKVQNYDDRTKINVRFQCLLSSSSFNVIVKQWRSTSRMKTYKCSDTLTNTKGWNNDK